MGHLPGFVLCRLAQNFEPPNPLTPKAQTPLPVSFLMQEMFAREPRGFLKFAQHNVLRYYCLFFLTKADVYHRGQDASFERA